MDWDEFSTYMMNITEEEEDTNALIEERRRKTINAPHKDMVIRIDYVAKERKYLTVRFFTLIQS